MAALTFLEYFHPFSGGAEIPGSHLIFLKFLCVELSEREQGVNKLGGHSKKTTLGSNFCCLQAGEEAQECLLQGETISHTLGPKLLYRFYGQTYKWQNNLHSKHTNVSTCSKLSKKEPPLERKFSNSLNGRMLPSPQHYVQVKTGLLLPSYE